MGNQRKSTCSRFLLPGVQWGDPTRYLLSSIFSLPCLKLYKTCTGIMAWTIEYFSLNENTLTGKVRNQLTTASKMLLNGLPPHWRACSRKYFFSCSWDCKSSGTARARAVGVWVGWGSSAPHVIILRGKVENPGCREVEEGKPKHMSTLTLLLSSCPLTSYWVKEISHMAHPNTNRNEKCTPSLMRETTKSHGKGWHWRIGNNTVFQK